MKAYVHKDGKQYGPFTVEQLWQYVRQGNFTTGDHACHDGQNWVTIAEVPGFAEVTKPAASSSLTVLRRNRVVRKKAVARQPVPANAVDSPPNNKKIILWSSMGGGATLVVAGLLIWLLGGDETVPVAQEKEVQTEAIPQSSQSPANLSGAKTAQVEEVDAPSDAPKAVVNFHQLQWRDSLACFEGKPYSGIVVNKSSSGGEVKTIFKDGKLMDWVPLSAALLDQEVKVPQKQGKSCWYCEKDCKNFFDLMVHIKVCPKAPEETEQVPTEPREELPGHYGYVNSVTFSLDGKWIVSGSYDGTIRIWDAENKTQIRKLEEKEGYYNTVAISPDSKRIFSGSDDRKVKIWDAESGKLLKSLPGHTGEVFSVALDANASRIVSGSGDGTIKIWNAESGEEIRTLKGHRDDVTTVAFSPDGKWVVSGSDDSTAKVWDAESGKVLKTFQDHTSIVESVAFIHGEKRVLSAGLSKGFFDSNRIKIWDAESGEVVKDFKVVGGFISCAAMSPDEKRIVYGCGSKDVVVMDAESGKVLKRIEEHELGVMSVAISPDGKRFVSGCADYTFRIWDMADDSKKD
jgi:WD40 repeat protein